MDFKNTNINPNVTLIDALKKMDAIDKKLLIIEEDNKFIGLISVGDIQRSIINNLPLNLPVIDVLRKNIRIGKENETFESIKQMMIDFRMEFCPVINKDNKIVNIYFWEDLFESEKLKIKNKFNLPVIIMAGGLGTRLQPLTNVLPKALIPFGKKTMLEEIFDRFSIQGCYEFYISVNYKAELIKFYLENQNLPFKIQYFKEDKPMGTAGSIGLLDGKISTTFFVTNCDILIEQDYSEILEYHNENKNEITMISVMKHFPIAYGTIETGQNGKLICLKEKPELTFKINSGMYILEPHLIDEIPKGALFHINHLIEKVSSRNGKIGVFPVSEKSWIDVGEWASYLKIHKNE